MPDSTYRPIDMSTSNGAREVRDYSGYLFWGLLTPWIHGRMTATFHSNLVQCHNEHWCGQLYSLLNWPVGSRLLFLLPDDFTYRRVRFQGTPYVPVSLTLTATAVFHGGESEQDAVCIVHSSHRNSFLMFFYNELRLHAIQDEVKMQTLKMEMLTIHFSLFTLNILVILAIYDYTLGYTFTHSDIKRKSI